MRGRLFLVAMLLAGASCARIPSSTVERGFTTSPSTYEATDPEGLGSLSPRDVIVFGEVHGSNEVPVAFLNMVDRLVARSAFVVVALEMPVGAVDAGCRAEESNVLDRFWTRDVQDGRSSVAMRELVCELKQRASQNTVRLVFFGSSARNASGVANRLHAEIDAAQAPMAVLVGNYHARNTPISLIGKLRERELRVKSLTASSPNATTWSCSASGCSARPIGMNFCPSVSGAPYRLTTAIRDARWDGCVVLPRLTASPPSIVKMRSD